MRMIVDIYVYKVTFELTLHFLPSLNSGTGQINKYFLLAKNIQNWRNFMGKRIGCVNIFTFLAQEALFVTHLYTLNNNLD